MDCSTPGFPVHHQLPELAQTHVPQVGNAIQPSHPPSSSSPAFNLAQHQGLFQWVSCLYQVAKVLELHLQPKNTGVGSLSLLQQIFLTQEYNQGLLHCRRILYLLSYQGSPRTLEWVAYPFCRGSSQPRNITRVSCIAGRFFISWASLYQGNLNLLSYIITYQKR